MGGLNRSIRRQRIWSRVYKVTFKTGDYFKSQKHEYVLPGDSGYFQCHKAKSKLHIPLLLSQYGYSTYRGS